MIDGKKEMEKYFFLIFTANYNRCVKCKVTYEYSRQLDGSTNKLLDTKEMCRHFNI